jgi:hypothetical protein
VLLKPIKFSLFFLLLALVFGLGAYCATAEAQGRPGDEAEEELIPGAPDVVQLRTQHSKTFRLNGALQTVFGRDLHYLDTDGLWKDVDLTFHQISGDPDTRNGVHTLRNGDEYHMGGARIHSTVTRRGIETVNPQTGVGIRWTLPGDARIEPEAGDIRDRAKVASIGNGVIWEFHATPAGTKLLGHVATSQGPRTHAFPFQLVGTETPLRQEGRHVVGEGFVITPIVIIDALGNTYTAEYNLTPAALSFSFNDSIIPAGGFPYVIDPTVNFDVDASLNDCHITVAGSAWPPVGDVAQAVDCAATTVDVRKEDDTGDFIARAGILAWDTSSIPNDATIESVALVLDVTDVNNDDSRQLIVDWYAGVPPVTMSDWDLTGVGTAGGFALASLSTGAETLPLNIAQNTINTTGFTSLRLTLSGGQPTGENNLTFASFDHSTGDEPRLVVTYSTPLELTEPVLDDAAAYRNVREQGDFLVVVPYEITFDTLPAQLASQEYRALFQEGAFTLMSVRPASTSENALAGYGDGIVSFYLTAQQATAAAIEWDVSSKYTITLEAINGSQTASTTSIVYDPADNEALLGDMRTLAQFLETRWGIDVIAGGRLTVIGQDYFEAVVPFIQEMLPDLVSIAVLQPDASAPLVFSGNRLINSGFEVNADGWGEVLHTGITGTSGQTTDEAFEGVGSLEMEITASSAIGNIIREQQLPAEPGQRWIARVRVQGDAFSDGEAQLQFQFRDAADAILAEHVRSTTDTTGNWVLLEIDTVVAPPGTSAAHVELVIRALEVGGTGKAWFDAAFAANTTPDFGEGFWSGTGVEAAFENLGAVFSISARDVVTVIALLIGMAVMIVLLMAKAHPVVGFMGFGIAIIVSSEVGLAPAVMVGLLAFVGVLAIVHMFAARSASA